MVDSTKGWGDVWLRSYRRRTSHYFENSYMLCGTRTGRFTMSSHFPRKEPLAGVHVCARCKKAWEKRKREGKL